MVTPAGGGGRLRASHADRERVVDALKAAFVQGRLTQDELDTRVGQALAARTYAELAALSADLPAEPDRTSAPAAAPARPHMRAVKVGAGAIGTVILVTSGTAVAAGQPAVAVALAVAIVLLTAVATAFIAPFIAVALKVESIHRNRSRGQLPPGPASSADCADGPAAPGPPPADPARRRPRRPHELLAVGRAG